ncbi:unnamed protein product, partial [Meganyctiphanes norvegica]
MARLRRRLIHNDKQRIPVLVRGLLLLCFVSIMGALVVSNLNTQQEHQLSDEEHTWKALPALKECLPVRHIVFLKTHKCASSTIQNILLRHALDQNLSVAVPPTGVYLDDQSLRLNVEDLQESPFAPPSGRYHFLAHHTRLNVRAIKQVNENVNIGAFRKKGASAIFKFLPHFLVRCHFCRRRSDIAIYFLTDRRTKAAHDSLRSRSQSIIYGYLLLTGRCSLSQMNEWDDSEFRDGSTMGLQLHRIEFRALKIVLSNRLSKGDPVGLKYIWNNHDEDKLKSEVEKDGRPMKLESKSISYNSNKIKVTLLLIYNVMRGKITNKIRILILWATNRKMTRGRLDNMQDNTPITINRVTESPLSKEGFSPNQLVLSFNLAIPNSFNSKGIFY